MRVTHTRRVKGAKLALTNPHSNIGKHVFMKYINLFLITNLFVSTMPPFMDRTFGPKWFRNLFPGVISPTAAQSNSIWAAFLTPTILSYRIKTEAKCYGFTNYQPNSVA